MAFHIAGLPILLARTIKRRRRDATERGEVLKSEMVTAFKSLLVVREFPIYRKHPLGNYTIYTRIDENMRAISITPDKNGKLYSLEIEEQYVFDNSPPDYHLGRGRYESSAEEFRAVVRSLKIAIDS